MSWIFSAPFPARRGGMMDEPRDKSGEFWQMLDARRVFHWKGEPCFWGAPKPSVESGNSVIRFLERSSEHPEIAVFQILSVMRAKYKRGRAGQNQRLKAGCLKKGWWDGSSSVVLPVQDSPFRRWSLLLPFLIYFCKLFAPGSVGGLSAGGVLWAIINSPSYQTQGQQKKGNFWIKPPAWYQPKIQEQQIIPIPPISLLWEQPQHPRRSSGNFFFRVWAPPFHPLILR